MRGRLAARLPPHPGAVPAEPVLDRLQRLGSEVTEGAKSTYIRVPTLVLWGVKDTAVLSGNLSGLEKWVENLSDKLYPDDDHWVMIEKGKEIGQDIRRFIEDKSFPKDSVYRRAQP